MQCELEHWNSPPRHGAESHATDSVEHVSVYLRPVLNWEVVCSPNILRTLRRTMICFLIELLVRRIWFG